MGIGGGSMNVPVSFELAKLLKEKGFDRPTLLCYDKCDMLSSYVENVFEPKNYNTSGYVKSAPTIAEVVMWLYKKHGIWISVDSNPENGLFYYCIRKKLHRLRLNETVSYFITPTEAYEAAIRYVLTNLA